MPELIYDRTFCPDSGGSEARAVIVDYSDRNRVELRFGITEQGAVTYRDQLVEGCAGLPPVMRRALWRDFYRRAKGELDREIRIATDPHHDLPEREIY